MKGKQNAINDTVKGAKGSCTENQHLSQCGILRKIPGGYDA